MKVRITAPAFCDYSRIDDSGCIELPEKSRLNKLYSMLKIPLPVRPLLITMVNFEKARPAKILSEGDDVSILWFMSGG